MPPPETTAAAPLATRPPDAEIRTTNTDEVMVTVPAEFVVQAAELIGSAAGIEHQAYARGHRDGYARCLGVVRALTPERMDVSEPATWPTAISPEVDRRRYPPHGRRRFGEPRAGDYPGQGAA